VLTYLSRLTAERDSLTQAATDITERAARDERDVTDTERQSLAGMAARCGEIDAQLTEYSAQAQSQRAYATLRANLQPTEEEAPPRRELERRSGPELETWGEMFVRSAQFENYPGAGSSQRVDVPFDLEQRAAIGMAAAPVPPFYWTPPQYMYQSPLLDVVGKVATSSNAVSYVQFTPNPQAAAPVAAEGALKAEAAMTATPVSVSLLTYAHWKEITRQALEDLPQIRSTVEGRLRQGLVKAIEDGIVAALIAATLPATTSSTAAGGNLLTAIRKGVGVVQAAGFANPNAVLLNPTDFAALDVAVMNNANTPPTVGSAFWGMRPIASAGQPAGTATVGDFSVGVTVFTRQTAQVYLTDSHADNFIRNVLLLLAETRALPTVPEPAALCECTVVA